MPAQDRGDIRHNIILELALARARDEDKPFSEAMTCRVASFVVADYWRGAKRKPILLSLDTRLDTRGRRSYIDNITDAMLIC